MLNLAIPLKIANCFVALLTQIIVFTRRSIAPVFTRFLGNNKLVIVSIVFGQTISGSLSAWSTNVKIFVPPD